MNEELRVIISAEISDLKKNIAAAKDEITSLTKGSKASFDEFNNSFQKVGNVAKTGLKVAAGAVAGISTALLGSAAATEEYRNAQAKLTTAFEAAGSSADVAKNTYNDLYRVLGDSDVSVEAAAHLAKLTDNQAHLAEWTDICQGVYATFGDSLPIESLTEAANETAKTGSLTGALADALNWAGQSEEEFQAKLDACNTEAEREALIRETLNGVYDEAAEKYEKNAAGTLAQNEAQAKMAESMAKIGEVMAPVMTMLTELGAEILTDLAPHIQSFAEQHLPAIREALTGVGEKIGVVIGWIADHWELVSTVGTVVLGIAAAISVLSTGLGIYNTVMGITAIVSAPVIGIIAAIVAGIAALVAIIVICVKNWDDITAAVKKAVDFMKKAVTDMVDKIKTKFEEMRKAMSEKIEAAKEVVTEKFEAIRQGAAEKIDAVKQVASEKFSQIKDVMGTVMEAAKKTVEQKLSNIQKAYETHGGGIKGAAAAAIEGVKSVYTAGLTFIDNLTGGKLTNIKNAFTNGFNNIKTVVTNAMNTFKNTVSNAIEKVKTTVSNGVTKLKNMFDFKWELPKIKLPHFKITGKFSLNPPSIPKFSVSWYAKGGIFDKPTLFPYGGGIGGLGEDGAEAIVPLEKNTEWLDKIAERLAARANSVPVILQVDGKTFAQTSINTINQLTRQTGSLGLNLV